MRITFFGTPDFALPTLVQLFDAGHEIAAVYTRAPRPAGRRGLEPTPSPVHRTAEARGLTVRTPKSLRTDEAAAGLAALAVDVGVVVAYGLILPPAILAAPRHGCLNLHPSILPRWRGAAPIQRPILAGDAETAAAIMKMDAGLDTGPIGLEERVPIPPDATAGEMHDRLASIGARLMTQALDRLAAGTLAFRPQAAEGVVYAAKIDKAEARIDWTRPAEEVHDLIRGLSPFPGAYANVDFGRGPERLKILRAMLAEGSGEPGVALDDALTVACGHGAVQLQLVQRAGKAPVDAAAFLHGTRVPTGTSLRCPATS